MAHHFDSCLLNPQDLALYYFSVLIHTSTLDNYSGIVMAY